MTTQDGLEISIPRINFALLKSEDRTSDGLHDFVARALVGFKEAIGKAWLRHLVRRSCDSTEHFLEALDDRMLGRLGLKRCEIRTAMRELEGELIRQLDGSHEIIDLQAERS